MTLRLTYVLPVHNQERTLAAAARKVADRLREFPGSEMLLVENASSDRSAALCAEMARRLDTAVVRVRATESAPGMGNALRRGIALSAGEVVVLTAADLPFGFTDLDAYLALQPHPRLAIGSKAHPASQTRIPLPRRVLSGGFRLLRRALLGLRVGDSQGTILIDGTLARGLLPQLRCEDFLISTEIICWAARLGVTPHELPVTYEAGGHSTVSPMRDSMRMARGLVALRGRLRAAAGTGGSERA